MRVTWSGTPTGKQWLEVLDAPQLAEFYHRLSEFYPHGPDGPLFWSKIQQVLGERGTP